MYKNAQSLLKQFLPSNPVNAVPPMFENVCESVESWPSQLGQCINFALVNFFPGYATEIP